MLWNSTLASPPESMDVSLSSKLLVSPMKCTFFVKDGRGSCKGSFLFSALDRLKVGVGESGDKLLIRGTGVFIPSEDEACLGPCESDSVASLPGTWRLYEPELMMSACVELPDNVVFFARLSLSVVWLVGVLHSSRLLTEVELLELLLHLAEVIFVAVDSTLLFALSPGIGKSFALRYSSPLLPLLLRRPSWSLLPLAPFPGGPEGFLLCCCSCPATRGSATSICSGSGSDSSTYSGISSFFCLWEARRISIMSGCSLFPASTLDLSVYLPMRKCPRLCGNSVPWCPLCL